MHHLHTEFNKNDIKIDKNNITLQLNNFDVQQVDKLEISDIDNKGINLIY